jgi:branched-chain amino acid transport system permease protein
MNHEAEGNLSSVRKYLPIIIVCIAGAVISYFIGPVRYVQRIILLIFLWAAATSSFNIISGYGGQVVFGYMMFVGTGAYTTVLLFKFGGVSPWLGIWAGAIMAGVIALIIGMPTLRLRSHYFAVATVAFPLIMSPILNQSGFEEVSIPFVGHGYSSMQFRDMRYYVLIAIALLAIVLIVIRKMESSRFGFALRAIKQNESAAEGMGIDTYRTKLIALVLSAGLGAMMGTVYAFSSLFLLTTHAVFGLFIIVRVLSINIVGGLGTLWGPVIAAAIMVPLGEFLNAEFGHRAPGLQDLVYGAALIAAIIYMPSGIWGRISEALESRRKKLVHKMKSLPGETVSRNLTDSKENERSFKIGHIQRGFVKNSKQGLILKIEGIFKSFGGVMALKDVNIEMPEGKILGIIGPNGAGKTTLFNVINGYLKPDKGRFFFEGKDITYLKPHQMCRMGIGRTFQVAQIFYRMTVLENIMIGALAKHATIGEAYAISKEVAQNLGLGSRANDRAVGLSIWETKMLELSRALATRPKLLLVDEPMAGLNPEETNKIGQIIKDIAMYGMSVIVIEHVVQSLVKISDLMVGLDQGSKVAEGTPDEVTSDPHIIEAYLGAKWKGRYAKSR